MINTQKIVNDIIGRNKEDVYEVGRASNGVGSMNWWLNKNKKLKRSKCCGAPYRKVDNIWYCSNCNMEK